MPPTEPDVTDPEATGPEATAPETTEPEATEPEPPADTSRRRLPGWLPWVVAVVAIGIATFTTTQWLSLRGEQEEQTQVEQVTSDFVQALTNWDASNGLDAAKKNIEAFGTGQFLDEANQIFGGDLGNQLQALKATSEGEIQDVFVQRLQGDQAITFAVVKQVIHTQLDQSGQTTYHSARVELTRTDGTWKVSNVELLSPTLDPNASGPQPGATAAPTAPSTTPPTEATPSPSATPADGGTP